MQSPANIHPKPYPELNAVLADLVRSAADILGENFHAACLQGSFAMGDFDEYSDVDFLIVVNDEVPEVDVSALQAMHARIYDGSCSWAKHLEGSYIPKDVLRHHAKAGGELWYLDNGARSLIRSDHCNSVVVRSTVREHGITLAGPEAQSLVDPIPVEILREEVLADMQKWGGSLLADPQRMKSRWYQPYAVVSFCRMLQTLQTGKLFSKVAGVRWGLAALDPRWHGLIERAWKERPDPVAKCRMAADPADLASTVEFIRYAIDLARHMTESSESRA